MFQPTVMPKEGKKNTKSLLCHYGHIPAFLFSEAGISKPLNVFYSAGSLFADQKHHTNTNSK